MRKLSPFAFYLALINILLILSFQNCGEGIEVKDIESLDSIIESVDQGTDSPETDLESPDPAGDLPDPAVDLPGPDVDSPDPDPDVDLPDPNSDSPDPDPSETGDHDNDEIQCNSSEHIDNKKCVPNTRSCYVSDGQGQQQWSNEEWGMCEIQSCVSGYTQKTNYCVNAEEQSYLDSYAASSSLNKADYIRKVPFLELDYIPQGIHVVGNKLYMSYYHKGKDSVTGGKTSIVVEYNTEKNLVKRVFHLKTISGKNWPAHAGGLVVLDKQILIPSGGSIYYFEMNSSSSIDGIDGVNNYSAHSTKSIALNLSASVPNISFISLAKDHEGKNILWLGRYSTSTSVGTDILGYEVDANSNVSKTMKYKFSLPASINIQQGVGLASASFGQYSFYLSRSSGDKNSIIEKVNFSRSEQATYKYVYSSKQQVFYGPAGSEDLHVVGDSVWTAFESGANYFQYRPNNPWKDNFPFFLRLDLN